MSNIADAVQFVPGVAIGGSNVNREDIAIRGLPGDYTLLMTDGRRQNTRESRPNGNGGFEFGFLPPVGAIERIEVIRGPMSSLYGSDAMGGVVNVITKPVTDQWTGALSLGGIARQGQDGEEGQGSFFVSGPLIANTLGIQVYGGGNLRQEDHVEGGANKNKNGNLTSKLVFTPNENHKFEFEAGRARQEKTATPGESLALTTNRGGSITNNVQNITKATRNHWALSHFGTWGETLRSELSLYQEKAKREVWNARLNDYDSRRPQITNTVFDAKFMLPLSSHFFVFGGQYQHAKLNDDSVERVVTRTNPKTGKPVSRAVFVGTEEKVTQKALFLEDEINLTQDLLLTLGVRMDSHKKYGTHWNPRAYLVYHINPEWTVKGGVAKAFRAPTIREISQGYVTSTQSGAGVIYGNPDLKPETSWNQEIGFAYNHANGWQVSATLFNTEFKNKLISYQRFNAQGKPVKDALTGANLYEFGNVGRANVRGLELATHIPLAEKWSADVNYTYQHSKRKEDKLQGSKFDYNGFPLTNTPKHQLNAKVDWQVTPALSAFGRYNYVGKRIWADQRTGYSKGPARYANAYSTFDLGANYQLSKNVLFNVAVLNIANERGDKIDADNGGNWSVVDGRRYWANVNISF
ncbi:TonB-dependent receptor domain-containing protein [Spirabiliibacterium falconis]|uniref:TonB-dependent receptor domain-containing protein n=1 Tax=Spirabiliibacterium falconis TaxID=572023 RepID=UPI002E2BE634|nr:TonB-dependent receptor [Spirabiliibacterium falconis]